MELAVRPIPRAPRTRHDMSGAAPLALIASGSLYQMGGMERVMQTVARELVCHGFRTEVVVPQQPIASEMRDWFGQYGATVVISDELAKMSASGFRAVPALARYFRSRNAALVNLHSPGPHIPLAEVLAGWFAGLPVVTSIHGYDAADRADVSVRFRNKLLGSPLNAAVIVMNQTLRAQQLRRGIADQKLKLVYNAVVIPDESLTRADARRQLGISPNAFVTVSFCRVVRDKGMDVLLQAVDELPDEVLDRSLVFLGGVGPELDNLRNQVTERAATAVRFLGHVRDPSLHYAAADVVIAPSRHEPFGLVFLEAAQHGLPSIGTAVGGIPEVVASGETGLLIEPENANQLARSMVLLSHDPELRRKLGENARLRVRGRYTIDAMVQGYARVFRRALHQHDATTSI